LQNLEVYDFEDDEIEIFKASATATEAAAAEA
jgi:hypothetical protein